MVRNLGKMLVPTARVNADNLLLVDRQGREVVLRRKWYAFYKALLLSEAGRIDRFDVASLRGWSQSAEDAGREVSRHLRMSRVAHLDPPLLISDEPTKVWRVNAEWSVSIARDLRDAGHRAGHAPSWFAEIKMGDVGSTLKWAYAHIDSVLLAVKGDLRASLTKALAACRLAPEEDLRLVSVLLALRSARRLEPDDATLDIVEALELEFRSDKGRRTRLAAWAQERFYLLRTLHAEATEWPAIARTLTHKLLAPSQWATSRRRR